jgi:4'-phosphopantetheinyl transferase
MTFPASQLFASRPLAQRAGSLDLPAGPASQRVCVAVAFPSDLELPELAALQWLSAVEQARADRFRFGPPREGFVLGRLAAKLALAGWTADTSPAAPVSGSIDVTQLGRFEIVNGPQGEPVVAAPADGVIGVSLSHVNGRAVAVAFPRSAAVGIDLELVDPKRAETVRTALPLSVAERRWLEAPGLADDAAWLLLWTAREALGKALGCGLSCPWPTLALEWITREPDGTWSGRYEHHRTFACRSWAESDCVLTLAFR